MQRSSVLSVILHQTDFATSMWSTNKWFTLIIVPNNHLKREFGPLKTQQIIDFLFVSELAAFDFEHWHALC